MAPVHSHARLQSFHPLAHEGAHSITVKTDNSGARSGSADRNRFSTATTQDGFSATTTTTTPSHNVAGAPEFPDFSFPYQDMPEGSAMTGFEDHVTDLFATPGRGSISSMGGSKGSKASAAHGSGLAMAGQSHRRQSLEGSDDGSVGSNQAGPNSLEDNMSDEFGLSTSALGDGPDHGGKYKENKSESQPAWSELKTKAGKERKRLPLACIACRRKKIRCSGEKPACKHCLRSRIPCVYKVTTRKAAPRTDYMAMLDKRLKRMEDRIIKIVPKTEQAASAANVTRAVVKPSIPGPPTAGKAARKRAAEEAFGELDQWVKSPSKPRIDEETTKPTAVQVQEREDSKLLNLGREALPPMDIREHLAEVYFENVYGQAYHLLHKPSYMRKLRADALPPVLVLSVCAISARFSNHPTFANTAHFLRGEEWATHARDIVTRRYEWPNITILTCLLILGLHEFGTCHGGRSWSLGGQAIRMAFALQLHKDLEYDPTRSSPNTQLSFIDREIRRRTMWACFLMDRFNSSGTDRPMFVREESLKIQLPIKEKFFQLDMPGPTENLDGKVPHPIPDDEGQLSSAKNNMGVASYMIKSIALWGRIINFLNQGGKESDPHAMWDAESMYAKLLEQAENFTGELPDGLKYSAENLHLHDTEGMADQFVFLHISVQQNILFMSRFASASSNGFPESVPKAFLNKSGENSFKAANRISDLLRDAEPYFTAAPFVGYCAFLSSTVHIFGIFSGNALVEQSSKKNLATNVKFLQRMKKYWGMFHFMSENLRDLYRTNADKARQGATAKDNAEPLPIFQYGDWFDRYPHGVSQSDFLEAASYKRKETGADAVLEQKPETYTVEEFFTQLSPPQSAEGNQDGSAGPNNAGRNNAASNKRKTTKKGGVPSRADNTQLEPLLTDLLPDHAQQRLPMQQQPQRNFVSLMGGQTSGPTSFQSQPMHMANSHGAGATHSAPNSAPGAYHALSPISPVHTINHHAQFPHSAHPGHAPFYSPDMLGLGMTNNGSGMLPQLDRQLVFGAYADMDPTGIRGLEASMDWEALASNPSQQGVGGGIGAAAAGKRETGTADDMHNGSNGGFGAEPSSAWFMPFNMEPPELGQDPVSAGGLGSLDGLGGMLSPGAMATPNGLGLRRGSHHLG